MSIISITNLSKSFGKKEVLKNINLTIKSGDIVGFCGPNGVGKTTILKLILGFYKPSSGSITVDGKRIRADTMFATNTGFSFKEYAPLPNKTGFENMQIVAALFKTPLTNQHLQDLLLLVELNANNRLKVKNYSSGMEQRLSLAMSLIGSPKIVIWDEPGSALDSDGKQTLSQIIKRLQRQNTTLLFSSHDTDFLNKNATRLFKVRHQQVFESESV